MTNEIKIGFDKFQAEALLKHLEGRALSYDEKFYLGRLMDNLAKVVYGEGAE